jgi:hypothetical protein
MAETAETSLRILLIGVGATALTDLWSLFASRVLGMKGADWTLVGRWFGHMPRGKLVHDDIAKAPPVAGERVLGWLGHYAIGVAFAGLLVLVWGAEWTRSPTLLPALLVGWLTLAAPLLLMQPAMGAGLAASRTPKPHRARLRSLLTHTVFGLALYVAAAGLSWPTF